MKDMFKIGYDVKMSANDAEEAEVLLYGEIITDVPNENWKWSKEDKSAIDFKKAIDKCKKDGAKKLSLRINSPGGVCTEAVAMRSILAGAGFERINILIEGLCASAATTIATLPEAHVQISEGSEYMIHNPWCFAFGNANEMEKTINHLRNIEQTSRGFYAKKTGQSEEQIKEWMDNETWFTAEEAVEYGFADELITTEATGRTLAAACVAPNVMATMKSLYKSVPDHILEQTEEQPIEDDNNGSTPVAGAAEVIENSEKEEETEMELNNITVEQLQEGNADLMAQIQQNAVAAERARISDIDALTMPGYEDMAAKAKADGTSAIEFQKALVVAMKEKGKNFIQARQEETAPSQNVAGGNPAEGMKTEEQEVKELANSIANYAKEYSSTANGMF